MDYGDIALILGGLIGAGTAVGHGIVLQRVMVRPLEALAVAGSGVTANVNRLIPILLHFTTFNWFISGVAVMAAPLLLGEEAKIATAIWAASSFLFGTVGNYSATRGRHYGWKLMAAALALTIGGTVGSVV